jgi:general secretion pathway protein D
MEMQAMRSEGCLTDLSVFRVSFILAALCYFFFTPAFSQSEADTPDSAAQETAAQDPALQPAENQPEARPSPPGSIEPKKGGSWHIHSPYKSLSRTRLLLDTIGIEILYSYSTGSWSEDSSKLFERAGALASRFYSRRPDANTVLSIEIVATAYPSGGFELYVLGLESRNGQDGPNPDLPEVQEAITALVERLGSAEPDERSSPLDKRQLGYQGYQLSYVEGDRAIAVLKALDYTTIEFNETSGETIYDRIFLPSEVQDPRLPVIIKMISASKTSLQESTADSGTYSYSSSEGLPDLGGIFLHRTTAAEPQNRLLIAYDPYDIDALERLVNLLRDIVDIPARQLVMEALVIEIQGDVTEDLGFTWGASGTAFSGRYQDDFSISVEETPRLVPPPLSLLFSRSSDTANFNVALHALLETSKAKILSNPSVLVLDGRQAKIQIGNRIPVVETTVTNSSATESILYFPVGIVLNLRPRVSEDGSEISMQVETIVSSARQTLASAGSSTRAPEVESRQVQTFVRVQNNTPFIIGGLTTNEEITTKRGVPFFSKIPLLGALFRRKVTESVKKEIIIVVTPHLMPENSKTFSYVIPQESPIFDSFGRELLYNAYRIRQQDVYDLDFLFESDAYQSLVECAGRYAETVPDQRDVDPAIMSLLDGKIPGEEILIHRMLWEIIKKTEYSNFIDLNRTIFFEKTAPGTAGNGFEVVFLAEKLAELDDQKNALLMTFNAHAEGTPDRPFSQPTGALAYQSILPETFASRLAAGNLRSPSGEPETWSLLLSDAYSGTAAPFDVLRGVIVLKALLTLNPNLPMSIHGFQAGRQIVFPTKSELLKSYDLIDPEVAELFYQVLSYYPAFEDEFKHHANRLVRLMGGCEWWEKDRPEKFSTGNPDGLHSEGDSQTALTAMTPSSR